jgi:hypothetical protein
MAATPVITETQYARIHAHAWTDPTFKDMYEKDPRAALTNRIFGIAPNARFMDLNYADYGPVHFKDYLPAQLYELYTQGTVGGVVSFTAS